MPSIYQYFYSYTSLILLIGFLWSVPWKGVALWRAARQNDRGWFVVLLILNTLGILEIIYIFFISHRKKHQQISA